MYLINHELKDSNSIHVKNYVYFIWINHNSRD